MTIGQEQHATGAEPLQCLVVSNRLQADVSDYPNAGKRLYRYPSAWGLVDIQDATNIK